MPVVERRSPLAGQTAAAATRPVRVSAVVPTYKRPDLLERCLNALLAQDLPPDAYEVLVVDDANDPPTRSLVETLSLDAPCALRYLPVVGPHGPSIARNRGWRAAQAPVIAFTDDDCIPDAGWLREGLAAMDGGAAAASGSLVMPLPGVPTDYELNAAGLSRAAFVTANCFCRRDLLEAVGGFDESFTRAWREDSDLHFRLLDAGGRLVKAEAAVVVHPVRPAAWGVSVRQQKNNLFESLLFKKHPRRYRRDLGERTPWFYYAVSAAAVGALALAAAGRKRPAAASAALWALLTADFTRRRLKGTSKSRAHVGEMIVTSAAIPPTAIYWRLRGALRHRVPFL